MTANEKARQLAEQIWDFSYSGMDSDKTAALIEAALNEHAAEQNANLQRVGEFVRRMRDRAKECSSGYHASECCMDKDLPILAHELEEILGSAEQPQ